MSWSAFNGDTSFSLNSAAAAATNALSFFLLPPFISGFISFLLILPPFPSSLLIG
jgi:hypothetical protein